MITIIDYGVGNIGALLNMFDHLGFDATASSDPDEIHRADRIVLPGIGAFDKAMRTLKARDLVEPLNEAVQVRGTPVLGVCLGMQLLTRRSDEGDEPGLGWIDGDVRRIRVAEGSRLKVPHIGWMDVRPTRHSPLFQVGMECERFYFAHSYHAVCDRESTVVAEIDYGSPICCAVQRDNVAGVQFHPEKSHRFGMRLLRAFATTDELAAT